MDGPYEGDTLDENHDLVVKLNLRIVEAVYSKGQGAGDGCV